MKKKLKEIEEAIKKGEKKEAAIIINELPIPEPDKTKQISNEELLDTVESGDVILWSGSTGVSRLIRFFSQSAFSHASIVFKGALDEKEKGSDVINTPRIYQATWSSFKEDVDGKHTQVEHQVMLNDLREVLVSNEEELEPATLRVLKCSKEQRKILSNKLARVIKKNDGDNYPGANKGKPSFWDYLKGLMGIRINNPDEFFCSELVAAALQSMEVLDNKKAVNAYSPKDFSDREYDKLKPHLLNGFELDTQVFVR